MTINIKSLENLEDLPSLNSERRALECLSDFRAVDRNHALVTHEDLKHNARIRSVADFLISALEPR